MTSPDDLDPDSAMASGTDAGEPGEHLGPADLTADERRVLEALERDAPTSRQDDDLADDAVVPVARDGEPATPSRELFSYRRPKRPAPPPEAEE